MLELFRAHAGGMFVVKDECYLPLFENNKEIRSFERGKKGCNCDDLDTVLLPGSVIEVLGYKENGMAEVTCEMTEKVKHKGFVYKSSVENFCKKFGKGNVKRKRSPMSLEDIKKVFERCLRENVPYCWGGNQFETIPLRGATFTSEKKGEQYECRGFDCSGLLYYISDGTLPHATGALKNFGERLFTVEAAKRWEVSKEDLEKVIAGLEDTDFIAIKGHVIVSYNKGLIEFRSKDLGCCFTPQKGANQRITELIEAAKKKNSDVWFVRWHSEYLQGK
jgi:hypothetical protein